VEKELIDYRDLIRREFQNRKDANPKYSLRQYARDLGLLPMHLSYVLKNQRGLSKENALRIAYVLGFKTYGAQRFHFLVSAKSGRSKMERYLARHGLQKKLILKADKELRKRLI
jgi:hypothetical protein